jgi:DNA-binding NarL/FixJ family response regulator
VNKVEQDVAPLARVVVIDDDEFLQEELCALLDEKGFAVVGVAANGLDGVSVSRHERPDVVLIDYRMPGMDGVEATSQIGAETPLTQVIMFTAYNEHSLGQEATRAGAFAFLAKGCTPSVLIQTVLEAADRKRHLESGNGDRDRHGPA